MARARSTNTPSHNTGTPNYKDSTNNNTGVPIRLEASGRTNSPLLVNQVIEQPPSTDFNYKPRHQVSQGEDRLMSS